MFKYIMNTLAVLSLHILCSSALATGPFGIAIGSNINELGCQQLISNTYECTAIPNPYPSFKAYYVEYEVAAGICYVLGVGPDIVSNDYGSQIKEEADKIARQLTEQYGQSQKKDSLVSGKILDSPKGWMTSLAREERYYAYIWEKPDSDKNINKIFLNAHATGYNIGHVAVLFEFSNYEDCTQAKLDSPPDVQPAPGDGLQLGYDPSS